MTKLNLPQWTKTHAVLLDQLIMYVRSKMGHHTEREESGTADQEDIAAAELYTGVLHTLIAMRRPVGSVGACAGRKWLGDAVAEACAEIEADRRTIDRAICRGCGVTVDSCVCNRTPTTSSTEGK